MKKVPLKMIRSTEFNIAGSAGDPGSIHSPNRAKIVDNFKAIASEEDLQKFAVKYGLKKAVIEGNSALSRMSQRLASYSGVIDGKPVEVSQSCLGVKHGRFSMEPLDIRALLEIEGEHSTEVKLQDS